MLKFDEDADNPPQAENQTGSLLHKSYSLDGEELYIQVIYLYYKKQQWASMKSNQQEISLF